MTADRELRLLRVFLLSAWNLADGRGTWLDADAALYEIGDQAETLAELLGIEQDTTHLALIPGGMP